MAPGTHLRFVRLEQFGQAAIRKTLALEAAHLVGLDRVQVAVVEIHLEIDDLLDLREEPRIDARQLMDFLERQSAFESVADIPDALRSRLAKLLFQHFAVGRLLVESIHADFEAAQRLLERLLEGAAHRHHLAHRFHLRRQTIVRRREFLERKARNLGHDVVDGRLERGRVAPPVMSFFNSSSV